MAITPWFVGDLAPAWNINLVNDSGTANLAGVTTGNLAFVYKNMATGAKVTGTGSFTITQANPGIVQYQHAAADVDTPGNYQTYVVVTFLNGPQTFVVGNWQIIDL